MVAATRTAARGGILCELNGFTRVGLANPASFR